MPLQMFNHLELLFSSVGTVAAAERLLLGVREEVISETSRPPEGLVAKTTRVWPIITVLPLVGLQNKPSLESLSTFLTDVRTHVTVLCIPMDTERVCSVGAVVAFITSISFLPCVLGHVVFQLGCPLAFVATLWTKVLLLLLVDPHVELQPGGLSAGVAALLTAVRLLPSVYANVPCHLLLVLG